ncbi:MULTISPECIES: nicotinate phosphoribosyltransferase [Sulfitobacter]|jgi:nicotinate phosphoribosyltransferase|uniref:Nicotinate phosphoribosyltransferase n=2 Tax=Sulfitobacter TaxID=60136 RepID=A0A1H3A3E2_9RHOB|nr:MULTISPECIES: nicotinate phosphoribosyltransferase [Sulfitobacter]MAJ77069.1 nicotinate phosphoribosyltransferase [Roseobacter sp.]NKX47348.1 nicotinate phosphoribosyltransferase [Rhodobacteraceae bacterium R_SAG8]AXI49595.1 nicotinate phosphoribosyltransferase [Sulfitobacter sp. SK025]EAP82358.1 nicotinate phosphoribosyltransferase [Sulfitobacter sp. NAS-14.1]KAJ30272.1 nicotinate phosphoribosyltransferase [Sulfitobacter pontiacus 3SOLIMAR09]|tara:strand:+ start:5124 stop:6416 length:1293 start_codon:yes stop_codon:yes gene_type:complete
MVDIASRVWNHKWKIDPIVRSLIDTDFYKLLMCQSVFRNKPETQVTFSLINRSKHIPLADLIDEGELREQLDHIRSLSLSRGESTWLRGNTFYGKRQMFRPDFMEWFEGLRLPPYHLERKGDQYELTFEGSWPEVMLWEIPALAVLMELRSRAVLDRMGRFELQVLYARGMTRVWEKIEALREIPDLSIADFGTRRRHSFLWQDWCVQAMQEGLGDAFTGTSNCKIAMSREVEAIGTNAHELPMVYAALAKDDAALAQAPYDVLQDWHDEHEGNLRIILPDTYGTKGFLDNAPDWLAGWTGIRVDSGDPAVAAQTAIDWWKSRGEDPSEKRVIFSDGLDVAKIKELHQQFAGKVKASFGWGTLLTNDFRGLVPDDALAPFSLVCKAVKANGSPTVKLSDNPNKAMGPQSEIDRYKRVFGVGDQAAQKVIV